MRRQKHSNKLIQFWLNYGYKHTTAAVFLVLLFILLLDTAVISTALGFIEGLGYIGVFIAGALSISFFTAIPALVILVDMAPDFDIFGLAVVAGAGSMVGDWLLMLFFQEKVAAELKPLFKRLRLSSLVSKLRHRYTRWILVVAGAAIIATPLPDEIGIALLGVTNFSRLYLLALCFVLNVLGFLALIGAVRILT